MKKYSGGLWTCFDDREDLRMNPEKRESSEDVYGEAWNMQGWRERGRRLRKEEVNGIAGRDGETRLGESLSVKEWKEA